VEWTAASTALGDAVALCTQGNTAGAAQSVYQATVHINAGQDALDVAAGLSQR
jgi:hypothetical protein